MYLAASEATATSCTPSPLDTELDDIGFGEWEIPAFPVDAMPWQIVRCRDTSVSACVLVRGEGDAETMEPVEVENDGFAVCGSDSETSSYRYVRRFVPEQPLVAGATYGVRCDDIVVYAFAVREDGAEAAPPAELEGAEAYYSRGDDGGCCGSGDELELRSVDITAKSLGDGGYIEVVYASGEHLVMTRPREGDVYLMKPTRDAISLTPVAANGARGETVELADFAGDLVFMPCSVADRTGPMALWLLAPFVWMGAHGRRRGRVS